MPKRGAIYCWESGDAGDTGRTIVWLHGAGGSRNQWPHQLRRIAGWRVLAPDLPGHGLSGGVGRNSIQDYAQDVANWLRDFTIERAVVGGHSMGAAIAMQLALEEAQMVKALVLIGGGSQLPVNNNWLQSLAIPSHAVNLPPQIAKWSFSPAARMRLRNYFLRQLRSTHPEVLSGDFQACANFDLRLRLNEIRQPTLVLYGAEDRMVLPRLGQELIRDLPRAQGESIEEAGHMVMQEAPYQCADFVSGFLERLES